jgi:hypothetical protein
MGQSSQFFTGGCEEKGQNKRGSWNGATVQRGLELRSRAIVRSRYQATTSEDTVMIL